MLNLVTVSNKIFKVNNGVRQVGVLLPLLFLIFHDDIVVVKIKLSAKGRRLRQIHDVLLSPSLLGLQYPVQLFRYAN